MAQLQSEIEMWNYIRGRKNEPVGIVYFYRTPEQQDIVSWSKCHVKSGDKFNLTHAKNMALKRAFMGQNQFKNVNPSLTSDMQKFLKRCRAYYKNPEIGKGLIVEDGISTEEKALVTA